jgi:hypothetical protein
LGYFSLECLVPEGKFHKDAGMKGKSKIALAILFMVVFAVSRIPGVFPLNFSAAYALAFCAGLYFPNPWRWLLPLGIFLVTDVFLNIYYAERLNSSIYSPALLWFLAGNYLAYVLIIALGQWFGSKSGFWRLLSGGVIGALIFYLVTNTLSWLVNPFANPEYTKNLSGWFWALTKGTAAWPETWTFFRNTLLSGGLFTALFVAAAKMENSKETEEEEAEEARPAPTEEAEAK